MRDKTIVIAELAAAAKELSDKADAMPDCGGLQGAAVLHNFPELRKRLQRLSKEAESLGITKSDLTHNAPAQRPPAKDV